MNYTRYIWKTHLLKKILRLRVGQTAALDEYATGTL